MVSIMPIPRADGAAKAFFEDLLPDDPRVLARPMFGNVAGFVNGNMFMGVLGDDVFVRLDEAAREELMRTEDAGHPELMEGRPMKEYVTLPEAWRDEPERARAWVARSVEWVADMSAKVGKKRKR
jgi:TfoX/Sxy family transcriptional regulator of competence genes